MPLLPVRAFEQRHHLTRDLAGSRSDLWQHDRLRHDSTALLRQRYQIVAGYEDANDADLLRITIPCCRLLPIKNWATRSARSPP